MAWRYLEYNPAEHAALPRESRKGNRQRGTACTPDELAAWLAVAVNDRDAAIWVLAATTGMRRFGDDYHDSGLLVCHPDGRPVHPDTITDRFNRLVDWAGVKHPPARPAAHLRDDFTRLGDRPEDRGRPDRARQHGVHAHDLHAPVDRQGPERGRNRRRSAPGGRVAVLEVRSRLHDELCGACRAA